MWNVTLVCAVLSLVLLGCKPSTAPGAPKRVFLVTIDTLRADHLGLYGYPRDTSPFIDSLGARGLVFDKAYASASHTGPSHASLFTGLQPAQHRVLRNGEALSAAFRTLAEVLREKGYRTAAFTTVSFLGGLSDGFEEWSFERYYNPAREVLSKTLGWLRERRDERVFVWIHLFDVHQWNTLYVVDREALEDVRQSPALPHKALPEFLAEQRGLTFENQRRQWKVMNAIERYDAQILSVDRRLEDFFSTLASEGMSEDALWVITSDHGEGLGSHGYMGHGKTIYNEQIRVPLVFYFSDERHAPRRLPGLFRLVDVAPTLAELVGGSLEAQPIEIEGRSFLPVLENPDHPWDLAASYAQRRPADARRLGEGWLPGEVFGLVSQRYKVIASTEGWREVYDLEEDPLELDNLADDPPPEGEEWLRLLWHRFSTMSEEGAPFGDGEIDPEYLEELEALGYL